MATSYVAESVDTTNIVASSAAIADQLDQHSQAAAALGLEVDMLDPDRLLELESHGRQGSSDWLLQLGVKPAKAAELLADPALDGVACSLAAGVGLGMAWAETSSLPRYRVEHLRQRCRALGGQLSVLLQPASASGMPCWEESPATDVIEALKREFDPLQQLARGRLPGVLQAAVIT